MHDALRALDSLSLGAEGLMAQLRYGTGDRGVTPNEFLVRLRTLADHLALARAAAEWDVDPEDVQ